MYVAVTTLAYPDYNVFSAKGASTTPRIMTEFKEFVAATADKTDGEGKELDKALKKGVKPFLKRLAARFDDIESLNKIAAAQRRVLEVQEIMADNMRAASERDNLLGSLDNKTRALNASAKKMFEGSQALKRKTCRRYWKIVGLVFLLILIAVAIILALNYTNTHWWGGGGGGGEEHADRRLADTAKRLLRGTQSLAQAERLR